VRYAFIRSNAASFPVNHLCRLLGVQSSAYYAWRSRPAKIIGPEELELRRRMKTLFAESRASLGSRMMMANLRAEGFMVGRERVRRLMKALDLKIKRKRQYQSTTDSRHDFPVAENILNRAFSPDRPNQVWGADITYLWTQEGWIYLAVVIDLHSRRVVGWAMDRRMKQALVVRALMMGINLRQPPPGLLHHSARGSQYASRVYRQLLKQHGMLVSMSRKGNCWDNAPVERFFGSLKREWTDGRLYRTRDEAVADVRTYISAYYNSKRLHSTLGCTTPIDYENILNDVSGIG
jgi:putative transposase